MWGRKSRRGNKGQGKEKESLRPSSQREYLCRKKVRGGRVFKIITIPSWRAGDESFEIELTSRRQSGRRGRGSPKRKKIANCSLRRKEGGKWSVSLVLKKLRKINNRGVSGPRKLHRTHPLQNLGI